MSEDLDQRSGGFLKIYRSFFRNGLWTEQRELSRAEAWLDILQTAAYAPTSKIVNGITVALEPGQLCASQRYLSARWKWSVKRVRVFLAMLEKAEMVTIPKGSERAQEGHQEGRDEGTTKGAPSTIITICNWEEYNSTISDEGAERAHKGRVKGAATSPQRAQNRRTKNKEQIIPLTPTGGDVKILPDGWKQLSMKARRSTRCLNNSPLMLRIGRWFRRGASTLWTVEEAVQLRSIIGGNSMEAIMPEIETLEDFYTEDIPEESDFRRRNLITLLNNWVGELDRAREHIAKRQP